jgi:NAD(P)-dependent dehydrogenase (short-subunit alcohol dehydrogenase family)
VVDRLKNKVAIITGGTAGIGRAAAVLFAQEGAKTVIAGRREAEGEETLRLIADAGGEAVFIKIDVSEEAQCKAMVDLALSTFGRLDIAFNNAGIDQPWKSVQNITTDVWNTMIGVNLAGVFFSMKYEIPALIAAGGGSIVNTSSVAGLVGVVGAAAYTAAKFGVVGLTKSAALDLAKRNIRVNVLCPGGVLTDMINNQSDEIKQKVLATHPVGRLADPWPSMVDIPSCEHEQRENIAGLAPSRPTGSKEFHMRSLSETRSRPRTSACTQPADFTGSHHQGMDGRKRKLYEADSARRCRP